MSSSENFCIHCGKTMGEVGWECPDCVEKARIGVLGNNNVSRLANKVTHTLLDMVKEKKGEVGVRQDYLAAVAEQEATKVKENETVVYLPNEDAVSLGYVGVNDDLRVRTQDIKNLQYLLDYLPTRQIFATGTLTRAIIALGGKPRE